MRGIRGIFEVGSCGVPLPQFSEEGRMVTRRSISNLKETTESHNQTLVRVLGQSDYCYHSFAS